MGLSEDRVNTLKRIEELEMEKLWDTDVEADPPAIVLMPNKVDYLNKKLSSKIKTNIANRLGQKYFEKMLKNGQMIIKDIVGIENFLELKDRGVVLTCNHFHPCDNYAIQKALGEYLGSHRIWKVIKEGNYTNFPGKLGFFFRNCNTLPLSSNMETMKKFMDAVSTLISSGEKVLIYPEQAMWWNYRKPRPLKSGAFRIAVNSNAPILPIFITMEDSKNLDPSGYPVQAYTINICKAIFPKENLNKKENSEYLKNENYKAWVEVYEKFYGKKLEYLEKK